MKKLSIKTRKNSNSPKYIENVDAATTFLRDDNDKITVINSETINIEIYQNGTLLFCGNKYELYDILRNNKTNLNQN